MTVRDLRAALEGQDDAREVTLVAQDASEWSSERGAEVDAQDGADGTLVLSISNGSGASWG